MKPYILLAFLSFSLSSYLPPLAFHGGQKSPSRGEDALDFGAGGAKLAWYTRNERLRLIWESITLAH